MTFEIRLAQQADLATVDALILDAYSALLAEDYTAEVLAVAVPAMAQTPPALLAEASYFTALSDGRVVGAAGWTRLIPGTQSVEPGRGNIRKLVMARDATRQGIATALMDHIHAHAKMAGMTRMHVLSTFTAMPFYASVGYAGDTRVDVPLGETGVVFGAVEMIRDL